MWWRWEALLAVWSLVIGATLFVTGCLLTYLAVQADPEIIVVGVIILVAGLSVLILGIVVWPRRQGAGPSPVLGDLAAPAGKYHLVVLNDDTHTYDYVVCSLREVFGVSEKKALAFAVAIDRTGRAVVFTGSLDEVTCKGEQIFARGPDPSMPRSDGPLSVEILEVG